MKTVPTLPDQAGEPVAWQSAFDERHEFDVYPEHFMTGLRNEFAAGWYAALKATMPTDVIPANKSAPKLRRPIETWRKCDPQLMAKMSEAAISFALDNLLHDVLELAK